ncbi:MAG: hypothetical protein ACE5JZ_11365, partial [Kiloniellales bacterium]
MHDEPKGGGLGLLLLAKLVCCGGLVLVATGALSGLGAWLLEGGLTWLLLAAVLGIMGGFLLRRWANLAEASAEPRQSQARAPVGRAPTKPVAAWARPAGDPP